MSAALMGGVLHAKEERFPEIPAVSEKMRGFVQAHEIAGAVTVVADEKNILHLSAVGMADVETKRPMTADDVFWIASMTKPITATAVMMMQEQGKLSVDDPVEKYLPEFRALQPAAPFGSETKITIKQCLTHSSGLAELAPDQTRGVSTLADAVRQIPDKPLVFEPGSKWQYCQSGINTVARIVEVVSGKAFPEFLQESLFAPLGMNDTTFYPDEKLVARLATSYRKVDGRLEKVDISFLGGTSLTDKNRYPRANGGLFSTAEDYSKFARMILNGGEFEGRRYLKPESVKLMTTVQSGDLQTGFTPGNAWGLGWCVVREPQGVSAALSPGSFGHGGMFGTQAWIDPVKKRVHLLLIQRADLPNSDGSDIRKSLHEAAGS